MPIYNLDMGLFTIYGLQTVIAAVFALLFAMVAVRGLVLAIGAMQMDIEIRMRYRQRAEFIENFYRIYGAQKAKIEEAERLEEEAREARYQASLG